MEEVKFSIIVPVYNAERYLLRCIDSIRGQTYENWEFVAIDDGSKDGSWELLLALAKEDSRIRPYHQENAGPGAARNAAIEKIEGDYVVFVDADDYVERDYLELLAPLAREKDVVFIDVMQVDEQGNPLKAERMSDYEGWEKSRIARSMMTGYIPWGGVRKSMRASLLQEHGIRYSNLKIGEEALFSFCVLYFAKTVGFLSQKPTYAYELHADSQSNLKVDDPWGGTYEVMREYLQAQGIYPEYAGALNAFNVSSTVVALDRLTGNYKGKERRKKIKARFQLYKARRDKDYPVDRSALPMKAKVFLPFLKMGWLFPVTLASKLRSFLKK